MEIHKTELVKSYILTCMGDKPFLQKTLDEAMASQGVTHISTNYHLRKLVREGTLTRSRDVSVYGRPFMYSMKKAEPATPTPHWVVLAKKLAAQLPPEVRELSISESRIVTMRVVTVTEEIVEMND